jgi:hypothetical protein
MGLCQVLGNQLAEPDPGVELLRHDVGEAVVDDDLDLDAGKVGEESGQLRPEKRVERMAVGGDPDPAGGLVPQLGEGLQLGIDRRETGAHRLKQPLAGRGRGDAAGRARQQPEANALLEGANGVTQPRGGHTELGGRPW